MSHCPKHFRAIFGLQQKHTNAFASQYSVISKQPNQFCNQFLGTQTFGEPIRFQTRQPANPPYADDSNKQNSFLHLLHAVDSNENGDRKT